MNVKNVSNPYIGPRPFQCEEKEIFFGRDKDADELLSMIIDNKIVVLYAQSGAGKTSLLNARMQDLLIEEGFEVLTVDRIGNELSDGINPKNVFIFNTLISLSLNGEIEQEDGIERVKKYIDKHYAEIPFVLIFDQFEEIFTAHRDRWKDREGFFEGIEDICYQYPMSRIVFALREDFIGYFDPYENVLKTKPHYFRLDLLNKNKALSAIKCPALANNKKYNDKAALKIVHELLQSRFRDQQGQVKIIEGEYVEPVQLQIVCRRLWDSLKPDEKVITIDHLEEIGGVEKVLEEFYETALDTALKDYPDKENELRDWIEKKLITPIETRGTVLYDKAEIGEFPDSTIESLRDSYLIRLEKRAGANWISLTHDRFIDPIIQSNRQRRLQRLETEKQTQKQITQKYKHLFYSLLIGVSFIIPLLIIGFRLYFPTSVSTHEKAIKDYLKGKQYFNKSNYEKAEDHLLSSMQKEETEEASLLLAKTHIKLNEFN